MAASHPQFQWLRDEYVSRLATVFETMAGERPSIGAWTESQLAADALLWQQPFTTIAGGLWVAAAEAAWTLAAKQILHAAGMDDADHETQESTYLEINGQALSGVAQTITGRVGREVTPSGGQKRAASPGGMPWSAVELKFAGGAVTIHLAVEEALLDAIGAPVPEEGTGASKTFDLLLDVEMPVSVSFGRAQVPLKEVLKLTTGSIVELNRSIVEPVEVIVNNCVVARGEVVVVEGNFGVRIQQVVSRQERLRTLT